MNFSEDFLSRVFSSLNWSTAREDYKTCAIYPPSVVLPVLRLVEAMAPLDMPADQYKSDKHRVRLEKRKIVADLLTKTREELFAGEFDR